MKQAQKDALVTKLERNYVQRPDPNEIYARGITKDSDELFEDYDLIASKKKNERLSNINKLNEWQRPRPDEMIARGVPLSKGNPLAIDVDAYEDPTQWQNVASPSKKSRQDKIQQIDKFFSQKGIYIYTSNIHPFIYHLCIFTIYLPFYLNPISLNLHLFNHFDLFPRYLDHIRIIFNYYLLQSLL